MFPSILIQVENGLNEFYFYFTNQNGNISPGAVTGGNLIWHESEGNAKIKLKKKSIIFFPIFKKLGLEGR